MSDQFAAMRGMKGLQAQIPVKQNAELVPTIATRTPPRPTISRSFPAADWNDLTADWPIAGMTSFMLIHQNLNTLRSRARAEVRKNDYARRFVGMLRNGVVGPEGFQLQAQFTDSRGLDTTANQAFERHWQKWAEDPQACDVRGQFDFKQICNLLVGSLPTDGEFIVRMLRTGPMGLQLQLIDPFLLDVTYEDDLRNGNRIRLGLELSPLGRVVAYHFNKATDRSYVTGEHTRVPASEILHGFVADAVDQYRGLPWLSTPMYRMHMLDGYEEAAIVNARAGAAKMGFRKVREPDRYTGETGRLGGGVDELEPGTIGTLGEFDEFIPYNPDYPTGEFKSFVSQMLRGVASGLQVSYPTLANDLEGVNYTSLRHDALTERDIYMMLQTWFAGMFLRPLYKDWLAIQLASPAGIPIPRKGGGYRPARLESFEKYRQVKWQGRRWAWVDPLKEVQASREAIALGITSRAQVIRERGQDPEDVFMEIENERKRFGDVASGASDPAGNAGREDPEESGESGSEDS